MKRGVSIGLSVLVAVAAMISLWSLVQLPVVQAAGSARIAASGSVASCDEASLLVALAGGGTVTFNTTEPCVITVSATIMLTMPTTINGSGRDVTLSGNFARRIISTTAGVGLISLQNITLTHGYAQGIEQNGGAVYVGGDLVLSNTAIISNVADGQGGGIYVTGTLTFNNAQALSNLSGGNGGGLRVGRGATLNGGVIRDNVSGNNGGGLFGANLALTVTTSNAQFINNVSANRGGGLYASGPAALNKTQFFSNTAHDGAGLYAVYTFTSASSVFQANIASGRGGGIHNNGPAVITNTQLINNVARGSSGGGGIYNTLGTIVLLNSSLISNTAANGFGGGINNDIGSNLLVQNSTFAANQATLGGAISTIDVLTLTNSTLARNPSSAGALYIGISGTAFLYNTVIANDSGEGADCINSGTIAVNISNLIKDGTCNPSLRGNPLLGSLGNYDGSLPTLPLLPGSPAIDAGDASTCLSRDQRGIIRPQGAACDLGAFESRGFTLSQTGGSNQSAPINTVFLNPLALTVSSSFAEPVNGGQVKFTAPANGASSSPAIYTATITSGAASQSVTANGVLGSYLVTATARGATPSLTYALTNTDSQIVGLTADNDGPTPLGSPTHLTATITSGTNVAYTWDLGDGNGANGTNPVHTYPTIGTYAATVTATNGVSSVHASTLVVVVDVPITSLTASNDSPTELGNPTAFTATIGNGTNVNYVWDFGDGSSAIGPLQSHTYSAVGNYTATITATNGSGSALTTTEVTIIDVPIVGLAADNNSPTELGDPTVFTATIESGTNASYVWNFGDDHIGAGAHPAHVYDAIGLYTATVTVTNGTSQAVTTTTVVIIDAPITGLAAVNDSPTQITYATYFTATNTTGSNVTYTWDFGDGSGAIGAATSHTYAIMGSYTATITATNSRGQLTATTHVLVIDVPIAGLAVSNNSPTQLSNATRFTATITAGANAAYDWDFGDGSPVITGTGPQLTHVYTSVGTFTVTVTAWNNAYSQTITSAATVVDIPIAGLAASNDSPTHVNATTHFSATITAGLDVVYNWDFGDGTAIALHAGQHPTHVYTNPGTYVTTITATNIAYTEVATTVAKIWTEPIADAGLDQTVFSHRPVQLSGNASSDAGGFVPLSYYWVQTGGPTVSLSNAAISQPAFTAPVITQATVLTFSLTVTNTLNFASSPDTVTVTVIPYRLLLPLILKQ